MTLVPDSWASDLNPSPKPIKMYKTLSATAVSGSAVTDTEAFYTKNCPFDVDIVGFEVHAVSASGGGFNGSGSALTVALQSSDEVDSSPSAPTSVVWDTVVTANTSGITASTNKLLFAAPSNSGAVVDVGMDKTYVSVPEGGSLRTTLSAQAADSIGVSGSTPVELLAIVTLIPTALKAQRYF
jgi:hypothetical protein